MTEGNILIADAGGTSTQWVLVCSDGRQISTCTRGVSPTVMTGGEIMEVFSHVTGLIGEAERVYYYGAGCGNESICADLARLLWECGGRSVEVFSDLLGAGRALFGHGEGCVAILGTGAATGLMSGGELTLSVPALGYILGDEGSGADLGKETLRRYLRGGIANVGFRRAMERILPGGQAQAIEQVYRKGRANAWLASFAPILAHHLDTAEGREITDVCFGRFADNLKHYPGIENMEVKSCGGVAGAFRERIGEVLEARGLHLGEVVDSPIEGLIKYHMDED